MPSGSRLKANTIQNNHTANSAVNYYGTSEAGARARHPILKSKFSYTSEIILATISRIAWTTTVSVRPTGAIGMTCSNFNDGGRIKEPLKKESKERFIQKLVG